MPKPKLLFISPVLPAHTGQGTAMRAQATLDILSREFSVYLMVLKLYPNRNYASDLSAFSDCCAEAVVRPSGVLKWHEQMWASPASFADVTFDVIHVLKLAAAPYALPFMCGVNGRQPICHLDLDDFESKTQLRFAELATAIGDAQAAAAHERMAEEFQRLEGLWLRWFDRVYVCSRSDQEELAWRYRCRDVRVLPNVVQVTEKPPSKRPAGIPFHFLFVGSMDYLPNEDAVVYFCSEVLPELRAKAPREFRFLIVGTRPKEPVLRLRSHPEVVVTGAVVDIAEAYAQADAVVAPIRAGGGTRIKILEACSYGMPLISTYAGVEGLDLPDPAPMLLADSAEAFVESCLRLMKDEAMRERLGFQGWDWVRQRYSKEALLAQCVLTDTPLRATVQ